MTTTTGDTQSKVERLEGRKAGRLEGWKVRRFKGRIVPFDGFGGAIRVDLDATAARKQVIKIF